MSEIYLWCQGYSRETPRPQCLLDHSIGKLGFGPSLNLADDAICEVHEVWYVALSIIVNRVWGGGKTSVTYMLKTCHEAKLHPYPANKLDSTP